MAALVARSTPARRDHFFVNSHHILASSDLLTEEQETLRASANLEVLVQLPRALRGRQDEVSIGLLVGLLGHSNATVRYWAADALEGCHAPQLVSQLPALIRAAPGH